eukprot:CAMPEP_0171120172 /NCGR_PEP_ID=MMETSP0766_2-20121228/98969_1 /TAXON_ID=439317 /ORGANISM="Gambierdiscus australes, Strain CAWD 149" /LENGTH=55 /DNA_ID=CAMNT_0011582875 /DNA_START=85 /DNA_END=249 /DNA_ORIENTATION=+
MSHVHHPPVPQLVHEGRLLVREGEAAHQRQHKPLLILHRVLKEERRREVDTPRGH